MVAFWSREADYWFDSLQNLFKRAEPQAVAITTPAHLVAALEAVVVPNVSALVPGTVELSGDGVRALQGRDMYTLVSATTSEMAQSAVGWLGRRNASKPDEHGMVLVRVKAVCQAVKTGEKTTMRFGVRLRKADHAMAVRNWVAHNNFAISLALINLGLGLQPGPSTPRLRSVAALERWLERDTAFEYDLGDGRRESTRLVPGSLRTRGTYVTKLPDLEGKPFSVLALTRDRPQAGEAVQVDAQITSAYSSDGPQDVHFYVVVERDGVCIDLEQRAAAAQEQWLAHLAQTLRKSKPFTLSGRWPPTDLAQALEGLRAGHAALRPGSVKFAPAAAASVPPGAVLLPVVATGHRGINANSNANANAAAGAWVHVTAELDTSLLPDGYEGKQAELNAQYARNRGFSKQADFEHQYHSNMYRDKRDAIAEARRQSKCDGLQPLLFSLRVQQQPPPQDAAGGARAAPTRRKAVVLGRQRVLVKRGRAWTLRYKNETITLSEARILERRERQA